MQVPGTPAPSVPGTPALVSATPVAPVAPNLRIQNIAVMAGAGNPYKSLPDAHKGLVEAGSLKLDIKRRSRSIFCTYTCEACRVNVFRRIGGLAGGQVDTRYLQRTLFNVIVIGTIAPIFIIIVLVIVFIIMVVIVIIIISVRIVSVLS